MKRNTHFLAKAGMIAALYTVLTMISAALGLASGVIQVRLSEMLCILPVYSAAAIPGVTVGCLVSNILCGGTIYDIVFGTIATLVGACFAYCLRKLPYLSSIPTILSNVLIIPTVLIYSGAGSWSMFPYFAVTVGLGEVLACGGLGTILVAYLEKHRSTRTMLFGK